MSYFIPELVIFDFDGVIVDSEKVYQKYWCMAASDLGFALSMEEELLLRSCDKTIACKIFGGMDNYNLVRNRRKEYMASYGKTKYFELKPGVEEALIYLKKKGYKIIIASSSTTDLINCHLEYYGLKKYFDDVLSVKDIQRGKPYPDIYLKVCALNQVKPSCAIAFEDAPNGIKSATAAGVKAVMVVDQTDVEESFKNDLYGLLYTLLDIRKIL